MMKRNVALALALCLALAGPLLAHGGYTHVMGTVTAMDATHVEVKTRAGKVMSVKQRDGLYARSRCGRKSKDLLVQDAIYIQNYQRAAPHGRGARTGSADRSRVGVSGFRPRTPSSKKWPCGTRPPSQTAPTTRPARSRWVVDRQPGTLSISVTRSAGGNWTSTRIVGIAFSVGTSRP